MSPASLWTLTHAPWVWGAPVLLALAIRFVGRQASDAPFRWRYDGVFGLLLSLAAAWVLCRFLGPLHIASGTFASTDYGQYCQDVAHAAGLPAGESLVRSRFVATLLGPIATVAGVHGALALGTAASMVGMMFGLYAWGHALGGRIGAVAAVVFSAGLDPLSVLARHLSFYPEMVAIFTLAAGLTALAARERAPWSIFLPAVIATAITPFVDLRGAAWIVSLGAALALVSVTGPGSLPRLGVLALAVALSWRAGPWAMPGSGNTVENTMRSVAITTLARQPGPTEQATMDAWCPPPAPGFKWGAGDPAPAVKCSLGLVEMAKTIGTARQVHQAVVRAWVLGWLPLCGLSGAMLLASLWRRPTVLVVGLLTLLPFATGWGVFAYMETDIRRVFTLLPPIAALLGGAFGAIAGVGPKPGRRWVTVVALGLLLALHSPWVYTWWGPRADWRPGMRAGGEHAALYAMRGAGADECRRVARGTGTHPALSKTVLDWIYTEIPEGP